MDEDEGSLMIADIAIEEPESFLLYDKPNDEITNEGQDPHPITLHLEEDSQSEIQDILNSCDSSQDGTFNAAPSTITFYGTTGTEDAISTVHDEEDNIKYEKEERDVITISEDTNTSDTFQPPSRRSSTIESSITSEVDSEEEGDSLESEGGSPVDEISAGTFKCRYCPKQFTVRLQATRHVIREHEIKTRDCRFCFIKFRYRRQRLEHELSSHRRNLTSEELAQYPSCSSCGKEFVKHASVRHHIQQVHLGKGEVITNRPKLKKVVHNATFEPSSETSSKTTQEIPVSCSNNQPVKNQNPTPEAGVCRFCSHRSKTPVDILVHELRMHAHELPPEEVSKYLACKDCGKLYRTKQALKDHGKHCKFKYCGASNDEASPTMRTRQMTATTALETTTVTQSVLHTRNMQKMPSDEILACGSCGILLTSNQLALHQCPMANIVPTTTPAPTSIPTSSRVVQKYRCTDCDGEFFHEEAYERHRRRRHPQVVEGTVNAPPIKIEADYATAEDSNYTDDYETAEQHETTEHIQTELDNPHYYEQEIPELNHQEDLSKFHPKIDWFGTQKSDSGIKCPICPKMLNSLQALALHEEWHDADELDRCKYCDQVYAPSCRWYLETHILENHPEKAKSYQSKAATSIVKRKKPVADVESDDEYKPSGGQRDFYCRKCDKQLSQQVSYDIHMFRLHPESFDRTNRTIHACDICSEEFLYPSQLRQHKERQHLGSKVSEPKPNNRIPSPENTLYMPDSPETVEEVEQDQEKSENPQRNFNHKILIGPETIQDNKCPVCHNTYSAKWFTESHVFKHHPEQFDRSRWTVYTCRVCRDEYIHKHLFRKHLREHGLDPDEEGITTHGKWQRKSLKNKSEDSIATKSKNVNDKVMVSRIKDAKCPVCFKQYACNWSAEEHAFRNHRDQFDTTDWNMLICRVCQEEYLHNHLFRKHLRSHGLDPDKEGFPSTYMTVEKPKTEVPTVDKSAALTCHVCSKKYTTRWLVDDHVFRLHPEHFDRTQWTIFSCHMCTEEFIHKHKYRDHLRKSHNVDPDKAEAENTLSVAYTDGIPPAEDSLSHCSTETEVTAGIAPSSFLEASEVEVIPTVSLTEAAGGPGVPSNKPSNPSLTCSICCKTYTVKWCVDEHIFKCHNEHFDRTGWTIYTCPVCGLELIYNHLFRSHLRRHHWSPEEIETATAQHVMGTVPNYSTRSAVVSSEDSQSEILLEDTEVGPVATTSSQVVTNFSGLVGPNTVRGNVCPICMKTFSKKMSVDEHIFKYHPEFFDRTAWNIQTCRVCNAEFIHNSFFRTHLRAHGLNPDKEGAPVSDHFRKRVLNNGSASTRPKRKRRRRFGSDVSDTDDDSDEEYRVTSNRGNISLGGPLKCNYCDVTFTQNHARHQHTFRFHRELADWSSWIIYKCYDCPEEYVYKSQLRQHCKYRNHNGWLGDDKGGVTVNPGIRAAYQKESSMGSVDPYSVDGQMDFSSQEFSMETSEFETIQVKQEAVEAQPTVPASTSKRAACQYCPATYAQNWSLRVHMFRDHREHVDLTSVRIHTCADCGIEYIYRTQLTSHCRSTGHKPVPEDEEAQALAHKCNTCEMSFPTFASFSQHYMENHVDPLSGVDGDDGSSFGCRFCNDRFQSADERNHHEDEVHPDLVEILGPCQS